MPRTPRNPGTGKPPHNGRATGAGSGSWGTGKSASGRPAFTSETARLAVASRDNPEAAAVRDELRARMLTVLVDVAEADPSGAARANAAANVLDRVDGKALARAEVSGAGGAPLEIVRVIIDPKAPE